MAQNMREDDELEQKAVNRVKNVGKSVGNKAMRKLGDKISSLIPRSLKIKVAIGIFGLFLLLIVPLFFYGSITTLGDLIEDFKKGVYERFEAIAEYFNPEMVDEAAVTAWREGGDPDSTFQIYQLLKKQYDSQYNGGEDIDKDSLNTSTDYEKEHAMDDLYSIMDYDSLMLSPEDILELLDFANAENEKMFVYSNVYYKPQVWAIGEHDNSYTDTTPPYTYHPATSKWWQWDKGEDDARSTTEDGKYGFLTAENVRGEESVGKKIYTVHWQDMVSLAYFYSTRMYEMREEPASSQYDPNEERIDKNGKRHLANSTVDYYLSASDRQKIEDLFKYDFTYYYDGATDNSHKTEGTAYSFKNFLDGNYKIGYRYKRYYRKSYHSDIYDISNLPSKERNPKVQYTTNPNYEPLTTEFVPESAPLIVKNKIEKYFYFYIPTSEVDGYNVDPEVFEAPEGNYCIGKWRIVDPQPFIDAIDGMVDDYYKGQATDYEKERGYSWAENLISDYAEYVDILETNAKSESERGNYYRDLVELYDNNQIDVYYYGVKASEERMVSFLEKIIMEYPGKSIRLINYENATDNGIFYDVTEEDVRIQAKEGSIPFLSYGVTYYTGTGAVDDNQSGNIHIEDDYVGGVFVSRHGEYIIEDWAYLQEGADTSLDSGYFYTRDQIARAVNLLATKGSSYTFNESYDNLHKGEKYSFTWSKIVDDVYNYNQDTGVDVIALLAICYTEYTPRVGFATWNWFNYTSGTYVFRRTTSDDHPWWNIKEQLETEGYSGYETLEGACMVTLMKQVVTKYWTNPNRRQNTYFKMSWNRYGWDLTGEFLPQNLEEALECEATMEAAAHNYCPWWESEYAKTKNSSHMWCNMCARNRAKMLAVAGGG